MHVLSAFSVKRDERLQIVGLIDSSVQLKLYQNAICSVCSLSEFFGVVLFCCVSEPDNRFALFYFVINVCISHVIITLLGYFLIPKSRDLVSHNPWISGLKKNGPRSRDPGLQSLLMTNREREKNLFAQNRIAHKI